MQDRELSKNMKNVIKKVSNEEQRRRARVRDILRILREYPGSNVNMIADAISVSWVTVKRTLSTLEVAGVVEKDVTFREYHYKLVAKDE